ncbi:MAG: hypothetical protein J6T10_22210 [Methanobrevibacter sp.]|nr:hypothetical protein [Methanobrevibacter sp.]
MSKYTTEIRFICENANDLDVSKGYKSINEIITGAIPKVFDFDFPIFDESYREVLERKILKHFYTREICEETVGLWKLRLDTKLNEIMPYYNKLYESELLEFNPLYTANLTRTRRTNLDSTRNGSENISDSENKSENDSFSKTGTVGTAKTVTDSGNDVVTESKTDTISGTVGSTNNTTASGSGSGTNSNVNTDLYSDTPQGALTGVENETYLTNARKVSDSGSSSSTTSNTSETVGSITESKSDTLSGTNRTDYGKVETTSNTDTYNIAETNGKTETNSYQRNRGTADNLLSTENYLETIVGYEGANASKMLKEFRETFLNIDMQVINELEVLFFQLW